MLLGTDSMDDRVRKTLVESLYAQPFSLIVGNLMGVVCSIIAVHGSGNLYLKLLVALLLPVGVIRTVLGLVLPRLKRASPRTLELTYELGAFGYATLLGIVAAETMARHLRPEAQMLMACTVIAFGIGIASRNAARPIIAIGQLLLSVLPLSVVAIPSKDIALRTMGICTVLLIPAMISIVVNMFRVMQRSVETAETSARLAERMQQLARTDVVTGLYNRAGLNHELVERLGQLRRGRELALLWLDLDRFKEVNDTLGHQVGDQVLAETAHRLRRAAPTSSLVARFGGDEFIVACAVGSAREAEQLAERLLESITAPMRVDAGHLGESRVQVGSSIGIALMPEHGHELDAAMKAADLALYNAKLSGRGQAVFYVPAMTRDLAVRREIEDDLRIAMQRDELSIYFQPIVDLSTGRIRSFEALVRWFHPEKGEITPDEFIPVAEETGVIISLGNWITAHAARAAAAWPDDITLSVNLSPLQIKAPGAALGILNGLREAKLPPERLELEITETVLLDHSAQTEAFMEELGRAGVCFALDDFGTGYSSLSNLSKFNFSRIKVDRSFVSGDHAGTRSDAIIRAVSEMAQTLQMEIVAEGIETLDQAQTMHGLGCKLGQGWYFSRAVPDYMAAMLLVQEREGPPGLRLVG